MSRLLHLRNAQNAALRATKPKPNTISTNASAARKSLYNSNRSNNNTIKTQITTRHYNNSTLFPKENANHKLKQVSRSSSSSSSSSSISRNEVFVIDLLGWKVKVPKGTLL